MLEYYELQRELENGQESNGIKQRNRAKANEEEETLSYSNCCVYLPADKCALLTYLYTFEIGAVAVHLL